MPRTPLRSGGEIWHDAAVIRGSVSRRPRTSTRRSKQFEESHKIAKQTDAVLKSTGGAANVTAKHVSDLATAISKKTGIDDEAIQSGENLLLTFTKVRNETGKGNKIFDQATRVVTDMSAALGQDTKSRRSSWGRR
jgi:acid phosphatase family membrane protein YuiD